MSPDRVQLAWAAGLFEGEGTFSARFSSKRDRGLVAKIKMADEDVLRKFHAVVGVGNVTGPYVGDGVGAKSLWAWQTGAFEGVQAVMAMLWLWLCSRRKARIKELLAWHHHSIKPKKFNQRDPITGRYLAGETLCPQI